MILNKINYKNLALYGLLEIDSDINIDKVNSRATGSFNIAFSLPDIQNSINEINSGIENINSDSEMSQEEKSLWVEDYEEQLEILNLIKEKIS